MASFFDSIDLVFVLLREERDSQTCFVKLLDLCEKIEPSEIWKTFRNMDLLRDIAEAKPWLQSEIANMPDFKGIYFGLDTLNMEGGDGFNLQIALGASADPLDKDQEWVFDCTYYGREYLIRSLADVEESFAEDNWPYEEHSAAEYLIFLGYSGIVLREAMLELQAVGDFTSVWGFHDGDMFTLVQSIGGQRTVVIA